MRKKIIIKNVCRDLENSSIGTIQRYEYTVCTKVDELATEKVAKRTKKAHKHEKKLKRIEVSGFRSFKKL